MTVCALFIQSVASEPVTKQVSRPILVFGCRLCCLSVVGVDCAVLSVVGVDCAVLVLWV